MNTQYFMILMTLGAFFVAGCGEAQNGKGAASQEQASTHAERSPAASALPDQPAKKPEKAGKTAAPSEGAAENVSPEKAPSPPEPEPEPEPEQRPPFDAAFREILVLEEETSFGKALVRCRDLLEHYRGEPEEHRIRQKMAELNRYVSRSANLRYAIGRITGDNPPTARRFARKKLLKAGELGRIFLRKVVRERDNMEQAMAAARTIVRTDAEHWLSFFNDQLTSPPEEPLLGFLVRNVTAEAEGISVPSMLQYLTFLRQSEAEPYREKMNRALMRRIAEGDFHRDQLASLYERVTKAPDTPHRSEVHLLALVYAYNTGRKEAQFRKLLGAENPVSTLRRHVKRVSAEDGPSLQVWAEKVTSLLADYNYEALRTGLVAWWGLDSLTKGRAKDLSGNGRPVKVAGAEAFASVAGVIGHAPRFAADRKHIETVQKDDKAIRTIQNSNYTFAAWIRFASSPDGEQPDPFWGIVMKEGYHLGLALDEGGRLAHMHYYQPEKCCTASSSAPITTDKWHHVVGTVDQKKGEVRVYVDGEFAGESSFPPGAGVWDRYDDEPIRIGAARRDDRDWACRFQGLIDEVAVYSRSLSEQEVKAIYQLRTAEGRQKVLEQ